MFELFAFLVIAFITICEGEMPQDMPIYCDPIPPAEIFGCLRNLEIVKPESTAQCFGKVSEELANELAVHTMLGDLSRTWSPNSPEDHLCEKTTCIFMKSGWLRADKTVEKQKVINHLDQYVSEHPEWAPAVQQAKANCLTTDLPALGAFLNCPAYDIVLCVNSMFFKYTQPSQWQKGTRCHYFRRVVTHCPICPEDCFMLDIPSGACSACGPLP